MASSYGNHTTTAPWDQVIPLQGEIERIVAAAVRRGVITPADVDDAVQDAMVYAVVLWAKYDPTRGTFAAYALHSIHTRLLSRRGTDALDRPVDIEGIPELAAPITTTPALKPARHVEDLEPYILQLPPFMQPIARLYVAGMPVGRIARKTGRSREWIYRQITGRLAKIRRDGSGGKSSGINEIRG